MSATQTDVIHRVVARYVDQVRSELSEFGPEQVAELTDGLERDLVESLQEDAASGDVDVTARFGSPASYAAELCVAAGLTPPGGVAASVEAAPPGPSIWRRAVDRVQALPWWPVVARVAQELAPVWWLLRAWLVYQATMWFLAQWSVLYRLPQERDGMPSHWQYALLLAGMVVASVWLGVAARRGRRIRAVSRWLTVAAVILVIPVGWFTYESQYYASGDRVVYVDREVQVPTVVPPTDGVYVDGMQVSNLFAYDSEGKPLTGVQLYDDRGRPVQTVSLSTNALYPYSLQLPGVRETWNFFPSQDADGRNRWNVYPLSGAPESAVDPERAENGLPMLKDGEELRTPPSPFAQAPAVTLPTTEERDS